MNRPAAKGKRTPRRAPCLAQRASGPTRSYLQTRVRASRLLKAAHILALIELTHRLHQAYRFAYDKQAADQLLPQNTFVEQGQERSDPCSNIEVPYAPPNVSVGDNVRAIRETQTALSIVSNEDNFAGSMAYGLGAFDTWFYSQVKSGGPWDYKTQTTDQRYEAFGNFNFGVVGAAAGYSKDTLLRVAGWVQRHGAYAKEGRGQMSPNLAAAFFGRGGVYPFGDQPSDTEQIERGIAYYNCVFGKKPQSVP